MKKILFFLFLIPSCAFANYSINNYKVDITILENGDVDIIETLKMNGEYNGFERTINYKKTYDDYIANKILVADSHFYTVKKLDQLEIRSIDFFDDILNHSYIFERNDKAIKGEYGVYSITKDRNGETYKIYNPSQMNKDIYISYKLKNMVVIHNDIAEVIFNIFDSIEEDIDNLEVNIHIPNNKELINLWVHGEDSNINIIDSSNISFNINNLGDKKFFNFRLIFDKDVITDVNKETNLYSYDKIIALEEKIGNEIIDEHYENTKYEVFDLVKTAEDNLNRNDYEIALQAIKELPDDEFKTDLLVKLLNIESKVERKETVTKILLTGVMIIWLFGSFIIVFNINKNDYKIMSQELIFDNPYNYSPSTLSYLINKKITKRDLALSILHLVNKKNISFIKTKNGYKFIKNTIEGLNKNEERIIKLLFEQNEITLNMLHKKIMKYYDYYINRYSNWLDSALVDAENEKFYVDLMLNKIIGISYSILGIVISTLLLKKDTFFPPILILLLAFMLVIYYIVVSKRTEKGSLHYKKWLDFKKNSTTTAENIAYMLVLNDKLYDEKFNVIEKFINNNF